VSISLDEAKEAIAALGPERAFITSEELLNRVPELDLSPQQIEEFLADVQDHLRGEGIEILEVLGREEGSTATRRPDHAIVVGGRCVDAQLVCMAAR
jgi:hypothetical protein